MAWESFFRNRKPDTLGQKEYYASAIPSAATEIGPFVIGDIVWNTVPTAGGYIGWVCVTAGATGAAATFKGFGAIAA